MKVIVKNTRVVLSAGVILLAAGGCRGGADSPEPEPSAVSSWTMDAATLDAVARVEGLRTIHRDIAVVCSTAEQDSHWIEAAECSASRIVAGGDLEPLGAGALLYAQRFDSERVLVGTSQLELRVLASDGSHQSIGYGVLGPRVAGVGESAAWVELAEPGAGYEMGARTQVVLWDAAADQRFVVSDSSGDSSPIPVPGAPEVVLISRRSGLASYWLVGPERAPQQLTNVGLSDAGDEAFVPLHAGELVWLPNARAAIYSANYGVPELWRLDLDGGARRIGPGRLPVLREGGGVLAVIGEGDTLEVVEYPEEVLG